MDDGIARLLARLRDLEAEIDRAFAEKRAAMRDSLGREGARFERAALDEQRRLRKSLRVFLARSPLLFYLTAPAIYALLVPIALLDLALVLYQRVCFPIYGLARVPRADFIAWDRHELVYLNAIERLNCLYCGYATGVIAYAREVGGRTEDYWCPIKHADPLHPPHSRYHGFLDYGDAAGFRHRQDGRRPGTKAP
ncbi:MAG: hypothetical protein HZC25_09370 [Rhodospirillales bacterium]|nr:hypothetical protein [Rhodospirillales bacterium]